MISHGENWTVYKSDDGCTVWVTCDGDEIARMTLSDRSLADSTLGVVEAFIRAAVTIEGEKGRRIATSHEESYEVPEGWVEGVMLPRHKYLVVEMPDGWHVYHEDDHGAYS